MSLLGPKFMCRILVTGNYGCTLITVYTAKHVGNGFRLCQPDAELLIASYEDDSSIAFGFRRIDRSFRDGDGVRRKPLVPRPQSKLVGEVGDPYHLRFGGTGGVAWRLRCAVHRNINQSGISPLI